MEIIRGNMLTQFQEFSPGIELMRWRYPGNGTDFPLHDDWKFIGYIGKTRIEMSLWSFSGPTRTHITPAQRRRAFEELKRLLAGESSGDLKCRGGISYREPYLTFYPGKNHSILTGIK